MPDLHDTQPNRKTLNRRYNSGLQAPPKILFWGMILFILLIIVGVIGGIIGFREVLQPAQQQRVIDQLPFMRVFKEPTPMGGIFPTIAPSTNENDALSLLDMPLDIPSPTPTQGAESAVEATEKLQPTTGSTPVEIVATDTPIPTTQPTPTETEETTGVIIPTGTVIPENVNNSADNVEPSSVISIPPSARIFGIRHEQQKWNNCGPATITMALSFYGWQQDQVFAADQLKPNREDKNVSPHELVDFVSDSTAVTAMVRMGGSLDVLKLLIANEFPVIIETGAMFEAYDWIGHYRAVVAYDDVFQQFYFFDSFLGVGESAQGVTETYDNVDKDWQAFNRTFIVIYEPQREGLLRSILGSHWTADDAAQLAFDVAQQEARLEPQNAFAWFNMGTSLVELGRYQEAATAFDQAQRAKLPWRMMWYQFGPFKAYFETGRYDDVLSLVQINLTNAEELEETYYWQGKVREAQGHPEQAAVSYRRALGYNSNYDEARIALDSLS
jgi:hypothetical protein